MSEWIEWREGNCAIPSAALVEIKTRGGEKEIGTASEFRWDNQSRESDIVAYRIRAEIDTDPDPINYPPHYTQHPSGVECITITEHMGFNLGNAVKYIWRADLKADAIEDLKKARWYIERELKKRGVL